MNMAIDEALLERATAPSIRFYQWDHPALSFGYFGRYADVAAENRDLVRRWTGGGIVFHGDDLTYSIVIPALDPAFTESSMSIYEKVHGAICKTFVANGQAAKVATVAALDEDPTNYPVATDRRYSECFANPVRCDVLIDDRKVAGAAQRRIRRGLLQQGSIQGVDISNGFADDFAGELSSQCHKRQIDSVILKRATEIAQQKYAAVPWLRRR
jgi:lipoyl(octanoyl) transferase